MSDRYEEYLHFSDNVPFIFHNRLERGAEHAAREANWHDNLELQLCDGGRGWVFLDGRRVEFVPGKVVAVNPGVIHRTVTDGELCYSCLIFDSAFCRNAGIDTGRICFLEEPEDDSLRLAFEEIRALYASPDASCRTARLQRLALDLLICLKERHMGEATVSRESGDGTVKNAIRYIREHYAEPLSLEDVAGGIYANKYVLSRQFKRATRQTVVEYIHTYRCLCAARLLESGCRVSEAARSCGFSNLSFFSKTFRARMGCLPSKWKM